MSAPAIVQDEKSFQQAVVKYAHLNGWLVFHPFDSRRSEPGWPDLTLIRKGTLVFAELKTEKGRVSSAQHLWLKELHAVAKEGAPNIFVYVWRPSQWDEIEAVLRRRRG